jgi:hypothetical protein
MRWFASITQRGGAASGLHDEFVSAVSVQLFLTPILDPKLEE